MGLLQGYRNAAPATTAAPAFSTVTEPPGPFTDPPQVLDATKQLLDRTREVQLNVPLVVRMKGTNEDLGRKILAESGLPIISVNNMAEAAEKVVAAAKGAGKVSE